MSNNVIYIIQIDNGQDYEGHRRWPEFAVSTRAEADHVVETVREWVEKTRAKLPEVPAIPTDADVDDSEWIAYCNADSARREYIANVKVPYDLDEIRRALEVGTCFDGAHLVVTEIPLKRVLKIK